MNIEEFIDTSRKRRTNKVCIMICEVRKSNEVQKQRNKIHTSGCFFDTKK